MSPSRRQPKPKLLLDEGLPPRRSFSKLNAYCDVKHVRDVGLEGTTDEKVYGYACEQNRIMVVINEKHFRPMVTKGGVTVIVVSAEFGNAQMDTKLLSKVKSLTPAQHTGECYRIVVGRVTRRPK